jgi:hypothetical protein
MNEADWLTSADPEAMLTHIMRKVSARKLRLYACACVRRAWPLLTTLGSRQVVEKAEAFADGTIGKKELAAARAAAPGRGEGRSANWVNKAAVDCAIAGAAWAVERATMDLCLSSPDAVAERHEQARILREIAGNPFQKPAIPDYWPATVTQLAVSLYSGADCAFALHDALLEAGHADVAQLAEHFREQGQWHPKGCWALDLILGKR